MSLFRAETILRSSPNSAMKMHIYIHIYMVQCKTVVFVLLMYWRSNNLIKQALTTPQAQLPWTARNCMGPTKFSVSDYPKDKVEFCSISNYSSVWWMNLMVRFLVRQQNLWSFDDVLYPSDVPDSKVQGANMGPTWVLSAPDGPNVGPINLAIRGSMTYPCGVSGLSLYLLVYGMISPLTPIYRTSRLSIYLLVYGMISPLSRIYRTSSLSIYLLVYGMISPLSPIYRTSLEWHTCILLWADEKYLWQQTLGLTHWLLGDLNGILDN